MLYKLREIKRVYDIFDHMASEFDFLRLVEVLSKTNNKKSFENKAIKLIKEACLRHNAFYAYRLAIELDKRNYPIIELEDYIIRAADASHFNLRYLILFPLNLTSCDHYKFQSATINTGDAELIADYASMIPTANIGLLEDIVLHSKTPKASYIFLNAFSNCNVKRHIDILIKSKKSKYLYKCATLSKNKREFGKIEDLLLANKSIYYIRLLATLPLANKEKIEDRIISTGNFEEIKKLYKLTKSQRLAKYIIIM